MQNLHINRNTRHTRRIYIRDDLIANSNIKIYNEQKHYIKNVIRLNKGDNFRVFNELDGEYLAEIVSESKNYIEAKLFALLKQPSKDLDINLGISIIKPAKFLDSIDIAVQLGVTEITPIITKRSQNIKLNYDRIFKYAVESTEQSERLKTPLIQNAITLEQYLDLNSNLPIIYANEYEKDKSVADIKNILYEEAISAIIGPEGGFAEEELEMLSLTKNTYSVTLGKYILRSETATCCFLAQIQMFRCLAK